jgi:transposase-like protein
MKKSANSLACKKCGSSNTVRNGLDVKAKSPTQKVKCKHCNYESRYLLSELDGPIDLTGVAVVDPEVKQPANTKMGITEAELRKKHDASYIILTAAENLKEGVYLTDYEFLQLCKLNANAGYRRITDQDQFDKYRGRAQKIIYWSHPKSIEKMKSQGVLN